MEWEVKEHRDSLSAEQEALCRELATTDPDLAEPRSRERMVEAAMDAAKEMGMEIDGDEEEKLKEEAIAFLEKQMGLGT